MTTGKKLAVAAAVVAVATGYMTYVAASSSWQYYLTADECLEQVSALPGSRVRVSGKISAGSLVVAPDRRQAAFSLAGTRGELRVLCSGTLPDNLSEAREVVVEGRLDDSGVLHGGKVLTRCASKYQSQTSGVAGSDVTRVQPQQSP